MSFEAQAVIEVPRTGGFSEGAVLLTLETGSFEASASISLFIPNGIRAVFSAPTSAGAVQAQPIQCSVAAATTSSTLST